MSQRIVQANDFHKRPLLVRGVNSAWKASYPLGTEVKLDKDTLFKVARNRSGLQDFGPAFWDEPLERLLLAINAEARLHPFGRFMVREKLVTQLCSRLRAENWFKKHPEILQQALYPVIQIVGLQRTGTTKLQRLLSADPQARALFSWEALNPAPFPEHTPGKLDPRIKEARQATTALRFLAPGFFAIHPIEYQAPEEDILLLDVSFMSTTPEAILNVPSYAKWLESTNQSDAYAYQVKLLKLLQWQRPGKHWILKSPHHLEFLHLAKQHYGNVRFIWTHRPVEECVASFLSMVAHGRGMFSDDVRTEEVVEQWLRKLRHMLQRAMDFRSISDPGIFEDVWYEDFIKEPFLTLMELYEQLGLNPVGAREALQQADKENQAHKYGQHQYSLEDFGLRAEDLHTAFPDYFEFIDTLSSPQRHEER